MRNLAVLTAAVIVGAFALTARSVQADATVSCTGDVTSALQAAVNSGGVVTLTAGRCTVNQKIALNQAVTVVGAGQTATTLSQTATSGDIFDINVPHVTIEDMALDTSASTAQPPSPVLFSNQSYTTVLDVNATTAWVQSGACTPGPCGGFGMRLTGPNPCDSYTVTGDVVADVNVTSYGAGGYSSIDVDCNVYASITGVTVHGGSVTPYRDENLTLDGLTYWQGPGAGINCEPAWEATGAGATTIKNVQTYNGWGKALNGDVVTLTNETLGAGNTCPAG